MIEGFHLQVRHDSEGFDIVFPAVFLKRGAHPHLPRQTYDAAKV